MPLTNIYFLDGPIAGKLLAVEVPPHGMAGYTYICNYRPDPRCQIRQPGELVKQVKYLTCLYRMVDEKLGHMKLEKIT